MVSRPLGSEWAKGWIHNEVITGKSWTKKNISVPLDTCPMAKVVKTLHFLVLFNTTRIKTPVCRFQ